MDEIYQESLDLHRRMRGKLEVRGKVPVRTRRDLSRAYTPGVAQVCREIEKDRNRAYLYTIKANTVAIVTDGSAVLGLGNIGGYAAIPVMEGKALLFRDFAGIDAFPICFEGYHTDFIEDVKNIAPVFGGINLEDIAAPKCFAVEESLQDIGIPVMHDDQHGTAVVILAALMNACQVTGKSLADITIAMSGAGAAGYATFRLLKCLGYDRKACMPVGDMIVCDTKGIIHKDRSDLLQNKYKYIIAHETNQEGRTGTLADAMKGADVFIGVSAPGIVTGKMIRSMNKDAVVFAMANPVPEVMPEVARKAGAAIVGTGRSDYPNQINNVLAFPGIFRGALDARATRITDEMKMAASQALSAMVKEPTRARILPGPLNRKVAWGVALAVERAARECGCAVEIS
ncbi:MAG TPA: NADP-dependent malic enzyme [Methanomicrobiales archaeon]|nr:NADP-dependent malic enzyme [Methanomicrobiales archaeon]